MHVSQQYCVKWDMPDICLWGTSRIWPAWSWCL